MSVGSSNPVRGCKCQRAVYKLGSAPNTLKVGALCIKDDDSIGIDDTDLLILPNPAELGAVLTPERVAEMAKEGLAVENGKPIIEIIQAWEKTVTVKEADGTEKQVKRFTHVLFVASAISTAEKPIFDLLSESKEITPELFAEAAQALKDYGIKGELHRVHPGTCSF